MPLYFRNGSPGDGLIPICFGRPDPKTENSVLNDTKKDVTGGFPSAEDSLTRLHRAGWSVTCTEFRNATGPVWIVSGYNGENQVLTAAPARDEAWWMACVQAQSVGMLGRVVTVASPG